MQSTHQIETQQHQDDPDAEQLISLLTEVLPQHEEKLYDGMRSIYTAHARDIAMDTTICNRRYLLS